MPTGLQRTPEDEREPSSASRIRFAREERREASANKVDRLSPAHQKGGASLIPTRQTQNRTSARRNDSQAQPMAPPGPHHPPGSDGGPARKYVVKTICCGRSCAGLATARVRRRAAAGGVSTRCGKEEMSGTRLNVCALGHRRGPGGWRRWGSPLVAITLAARANLTPRCSKSVRVVVGDRLVWGGPQLEGRAPHVRGSNSRPHRLLDSSVCPRNRFFPS